MEQYNEITTDQLEPIGCGFCYNSRRKQDIELFFLDKANNIRICQYCPYCGRLLKIGGDYV